VGDPEGLGRPAPVRVGVDRRRRVRDDGLAGYYEPPDDGTLYSADRDDISAIGAALPRLRL
jgi:hypothetical protein